MARKKANSSRNNNERWLVSYADFMTLLFILFIILYSFSQVDLQKFQQISQSLYSTFSGGSTPFDDFKGTGKGTEDAAGTFSYEENTLNELVREIDKYATEKGIKSNIRLKLDERGLYIAITGTVLYADASATLTTPAKDFINIIFYRLKSLPNQIRIEGHTDNRPILSANFPSNWELSAARSINLIRYLIEEYNFDPQRLSSAAYGEYRPVASNETPEGQSENRRVEIIILKTVTNSD